MEAGADGKLRRLLGEDVYRSADAAGAVLDRGNVDERHHARTVWALDDDFLIAPSLPGREHIAHGTFRMRYRIAIQAEQALGAAETNLRIAALRGATP